MALPSSLAPPRMPSVSRFDARSPLLGAQSAGYAMPTFESLLPARFRLDEMGGAPASGFGAFPSFEEIFGGAQAGGALGAAGGAWAEVDRWNTQIAAAAAKHGVPANVIKAVIRLESGGDPTVVSPAGAAGLMQVMPAMHGTTRQALMDPAYAIDKGTSILKDNFNRWGSWELATKAYLAGNPYSTATDYYGTGVDSYWSRVQTYMKELETVPFGSSAGRSSGSGVGGSLEAIWGGRQVPLTQEFGLTDFAQGAGAWMYGYASSLGVQGHAGLDYGMVPGTAIYTPVSGTVISAGGTGYYSDERYNKYTPGIGEFKLKLDNGDELILGHMEAINLRPGQRVSAGTLVGRSGTYNGGHVHVEYRKYMPGATSSGYTAIDPRAAFGAGSSLGAAVASGFGGGALGSGAFGSGASTGGAAAASRSLGASLGSLFRWS